MLLSMAGLALAMPYVQQDAILRSARQADIANYYGTTGVVLQDVPAISPFFACARAYEYRNLPVNGTLMVDRISCGYNSYYHFAWLGIQMCNRNNVGGKLLIDESVASPVSYVCAAGPGLA